MIIFVRDNEGFEPRVQNYLEYFDNNGLAYHVLAWNRNGSAISKQKYTFFQRRAEYGKRIANIPNKVAWMWFETKELWKCRDECTVIHACDIDAVLPALLIGKVFHKKVIFDIFDWISSLTGKGMIYSIVEWLQNFAYKYSDAVILCEEERKKQAKSQNRKVMVLPNIPSRKIAFDSTILHQIEQQRTEYRCTISYVGVFDRDRGLENLLDCISKRKDMLLNIAGFGVLDDMIKEYAKEYGNICYWGRVEYAVGQSIMKNSDLIAGMYHLTSPLHKYAAPNKYYESLLLGVPMITTAKTLVGAKVAEYNTGFVIPESKEALEDLLDDPSLEKEIEAKKTNCRRTWDEVYSGYYDNFMKETYEKFVLEG